jgi:hypothetical protein
MPPRHFWWLVADAREEAERAQKRGKRGLSSDEAQELLEWMDKP